MRIIYSNTNPTETRHYGSLLKTKNNDKNTLYEQISLWDILNIKEKEPEKKEQPKRAETNIPAMPGIRDVWYRKPATIVWWEDGTKTAVKCQYSKGDRYDKEKGLAMAIVKKMYGNNGSFNEIFKQWGCWDDQM